VIFIDQNLAATAHFTSWVSDSQGQLSLHMKSPIFQ